MKDKFEHLRLVQSLPIGYKRANILDTVKDYKPVAQTALQNIKPTFRSGIDAVRGRGEGDTITDRFTSNFVSNVGFDNPGMQRLARRRLEKGLGDYARYIPENVWDNSQFYQDMWDNSDHFQKAHQSFQKGDWSGAMGQLGQSQLGQDFSNHMGSQATNILSSGFRDMNWSDRFRMILGMIPMLFGRSMTSGARDQMGNLLSGATPQLGQSAGEFFSQRFGPQEQESPSQ